MNEPQVSGPVVPENPVATLNKEKHKKRPGPQRRGAQRTQGPEPVIEPPPRANVVRIPEPETVVVGKANIEGSQGGKVTTETTGPKGYVEVVTTTPPIKSPFDVVIGEIVLLKGRVECEVLGLTKNGEVRLKTVDKALMPGKDCDEFCAKPADIVKKAGTP
jgi:hypothetical protein